MRSRGQPPVVSCQKGERQSQENTGGRQRLTPAIQAGIVNELWTMERLYDEVLGRVSEDSAPRQIGGVSCCAYGTMRPFPKGHLNEHRRTANITTPAVPLDWNATVGNILRSGNGGRHGSLACPA